MGAAKSVACQIQTVSATLMMAVRDGAAGSL
jgi:hypothetical protein